MSVLYALDDKFMAAAYCIIVAAFFDGMDGKLARAFDSCSTLGMELDSLCDAISFCFAPAILLYSWSLSSGNIVGLIFVGAYLCAGLFRLAKFNIVSHENKNFFVGLPTTIASLWVAGFVIASSWLETSRWYLLLKPGHVIVIIAMLALLMVSHVRFPSFKSKHGIIPMYFTIPLGIIAVGIYALTTQVPLVLTTVSTYIGISLCISGIMYLKKRFLFS